MLNRLKPHVFYLVLITGLLGCQESTEEISFPEGNIQADSPLAFLVKNTVSLDGSFDNAIDNSSCITVKLPVDVVVNDQALTVSSDEDILMVEQILNAQSFDFDTIRLTFPIEIVKNDYSEQTLNSQEELDVLRRTCVEGGNDADIECADFNYPVSFQVYDSENQRAVTEALNSDREMFRYLSDLIDTHIVSMAFPVTLTLSDGSDHQVQNNAGLSAAIESSIGTCDESDVQFYNNVINVPFETGRLSIQLTDAPFPTDLVAEANVVIEEVEIKLDDEEEAFLTLSDAEFDVNLLELTNGATLLLADLEIPEGAYSEIRLAVKESNVLLNDDTSFDLEIPSDKIKVKISPSIEIDTDTPVELLLDFDVSRSFVVQGNPNTPAGIKGFLFKPTVKVANLASTGSLGGMVEDENSAALQGAQISVFASDTLNTTSFTDTNGEYKILGLSQGDYSVTAELDGFQPSTTTATIVIKENAVVNFQLVED